MEFFNPVGRMSEQFEGLSYVEAMNRCLAELASCDGIVICSGWENSPGCRIEARTARELQLPRWYGTGDYGISWGRVERNAQQRERAL